MVSKHHPSEEASAQYSSWLHGRADTQNSAAPSRLRKGSTLSSMFAKEIWKKCSLSERYCSLGVAEHAPSARENRLQGPPWHTAAPRESVIGQYPPYASKPSTIPDSHHVK